jgi:pilus assembly protein CpaB
VGLDEMISPNPKPRRPAGSRRSASRAVIFTVIAIAAGVGVATTLKSYVDKHLTGGPKSEGIVVAAMELPLATTLASEHLTVVKWPSDSLPEGAFSNPKELVGRVVLAKLSRNEVVLPSKLATREAGSGMAALIPENMRAAAVRVDDVVGVAGFVHPDDRVDVIVTMRAESGGETSSKVILQNVRVLAVGKDLKVDDQKRSQALPVTVATLLVTTEQSEMLALASAQGKLLLTLRPWADHNRVPTNGIGGTALLGVDRPHVAEGTPSRDDERAAPPAPRASGTASAPPAAQVAAAPVAPASGEVVEILRGDRVEERKFRNQPVARESSHGSQ